MIDTLEVLFTVKDVSSSYSILLVIFTALIGGGLASFIFDLVKYNKNEKRIKLMFVSNIVLIEERLSEILKHDDSYQWMRQKIHYSFIEDNLHLLAGIRDETSKAIICYYNLLEDLRFIDDVENTHIDKLNSEKLYDSAELMKKDLGPRKRKLREDIIEQGRRISNSTKRNKKSKNSKRCVTTKSRAN